VSAGPGPGETLDAIGGGEVRLLQRRDGYRFNLDSVLVAAFALSGRDGARALDVVDVGTGCGVVALLVKSRRPAWRVAGLELQPGLHDLARRNAALNGLDVAMAQVDARALPGAMHGAFDLAVSNPPYFDAGAGLPCDDGERHLARQDEALRPHELAGALSALLRPGGAACVVYPAARLTALLEALLSARLAPTRLRFVHPTLLAPAGHVLVEARPRSRRPLVVEPPLVVHAPSGGYSDEVAGWLAPHRLASPGSVA
jgi:tRNA1(Val) A37 N6-methylase TrmN6